jgi:hypothetical protein
LDCDPSLCFSDGNPPSRLQTRQKVVPVHPVPPTKETGTVGLSTSGEWNEVPYRRGGFGTNIHNNLYNSSFDSGP